MQAETYPFVVQPLPYDYDALTPILDEKTLHFHHDKHYKTYVDNLNSTLADYPELQKMSLKELLMKLDTLPAAAQTPIRNNGGGVFNHELYFGTMRQPMGQMPEGVLADAIDRDFGSYNQWKEQMKQAAASQFGSGWAWLVTDKDGKGSPSCRQPTRMCRICPRCPLFCWWTCGSTLTICSTRICGRPMWRAGSI